MPPKKPAKKDKDLKSEIMSCIYEEENKGSRCLSIKMARELLPGHNPIKAHNTILRVLEVLRESNLITYIEEKLPTPISKDIPVLPLTAFVDIRLTAKGIEYIDDPFKFWNKELTKKVAKSVDRVIKTSLAQE